MFKSGDPTQHIGGSLRTPHHNCWLQMLNPHRRPANPHINLDVVVGRAGDIVGLLESSPDREVNDAVLLVDQHGVAGRDEPLTELGHALRVNISPHVLHEIVPSIQSEIVPRIQQALEIALLEIERPHRRALGKVDDSGLIFCRHSGLREERATEDGDTNECDSNKLIHKFAAALRALSLHQFSSLNSMRMCLTSRSAAYSVVCFSVIAHPSMAFPRTLYLLS